MLLPILIWTGMVALVEPAQLIMALVEGLFIFAIPLMAWIILAIVGFTFGRRKISDLP